MRLIDDGVEFLLRHVADIRIFLVGAAAAGRAGLDDIAAVSQIGARQLAQFPRAVGALEARAHRRARKDQIKMRAGHVGEAADEHARSGENAGVDGVAHRAKLRCHQPAAADETEIT